MSIHERISLIRKTLKLSCAQFSAPMGYSRSTIWAIERKKPPYDDPQKIDKKLLLAICRTFDVREEYLLTGKGEMFRDHTEGIDLPALVETVFDCLRDEIKPGVLEGFLRVAQNSVRRK